MDILTRVNWVDVLVLIIVLRTSYVSFKDGLSHELFPLFGSVVMVLVSLRYYSQMGLIFNKNLLGMPLELANFLAFVILVIVSGVLLKLLKYGIDFVIKMEWNPAVERVGGGVCGIVRSFVAASLVLMVLCMMPAPYMQVSVREKSLTGECILGIGPYIFEKAAQVIPFLGTGGNAVSQEEILKNLETKKAIQMKAPERRDWMGSSKRPDHI